MPIIGMARLAGSLTSCANGRATASSTMAVSDADACHQPSAWLKTSAATTRSGDLRASAAGARRGVASAAPSGHSSMFATVVQGLAKAGCAKDASHRRKSPSAATWPRRRSPTAYAARSAFEAAVFRIDHYLAKEAVQNLLYFRFANAFLSRFGIAISSTACRSPWPRILGWRDAAVFTRRWRDPRRGAEPSVAGDRACWRWTHRSAAPGCDACREAALVPRHAAA